MGWIFALVILETSRGKVILADTVWDTRLEKRPAAFIQSATGTKFERNKMIDAYRRLGKLLGDIVLSTLACVMGCSLAHASGIRMWQNLRSVGLSVNSNEGREASKHTKTGKCHRVEEEMKE